MKHEYKESVHLLLTPFKPNVELMRKSMENPFKNRIPPSHLLVLPPAKETPYIGNHFIGSIRMDHTKYRLRTQDTYQCRTCNQWANLRENVPHDEACPHAFKPFW